MTKFCRDCKFVYGLRDAYAKCNNPKVGIDVVTGELALTYCNMNRGASFGLCGPEGKWFEPKEKTK